MEIFFGSISDWLIDKLLIENRLKNRDINYEIIQR